MKDTTATTANIRPVTLQEINRVVRELELNKLPTEWMLAAPDGRLWKGAPEKLLEVLIPHHPLLKTLSFGEILKDTP